MRKGWNKMNGKFRESVSGKRTTFIDTIVLKVLFLLLVISVCWFPQKALAAGTNLSNASWISTNTTYTGSAFRNDASGQYYKLQLNVACTICIETRTGGSNERALTTLRDASGNSLLCVSAADPKNWGYRSSKLYESVRPSVYYIVIEHPGTYNPVTNYSFSVNKFVLYQIRTF